MSNIFEKYPENLNIEFDNSFKVLKDNFSDEQRNEWKDLIKSITDSGVRSWEITTALLKKSVDLSEILKGAELIQWAKMISNLVNLSPVLASSYIQNSDKFLSITKGRHIDSMSVMAENIYDGSWKSGNFASKVFDHSPKFLKVLTFAEFEKIIYFLNEITTQSYDMAVECLDYSYNFLTKFHSKHTGIEFLSNLKSKSSRDLKNILETSPKFLIKFDENQRVTLMELILSIIDAGGYSSSTIMDDVATPFTLIHRNSYDEILELCKELGQVQPQVIIGFLTKVPEILNKIDINQMKEWFDEGIKLLNLNRDAGVAYFKLESLTSETSLSRISSSVEYDSVKDLLQLYCSALAGVDLEILPSSELVDKNIGWSSTMNPTTEGKSIYVPEIINRYDNKITNYKWFKVISSHQVGRLEFGSFKFHFDSESIYFNNMREDLYNDFSKKIKTQEQIHFPLEDENSENKIDAVITKKTDFNKFFELFQSRKLVSDIFAIVEDTRVENRIKNKYSGLIKDFDNVKLQALEKRPNINTLNAQDAMVEFLVQISLGKSDKTKVPKKYLDKFKNMFIILNKIVNNDSDVHDSSEATIRIYKLIHSTENENTENEETEDLDLDQNQDQDYYEDDNILQEIMQFMMNQDSMDIHSESDDYQSPEQVDYRGDFKPELVQLLENMRTMDSEDSEFSQENITPEMLKELLDQMEDLDIEATERPIDSSTDTIAENILKEISAELSENSKHNPGDTDNSEDFEELETDDPESYIYDEWDFSFKRL